MNPLPQVLVIDDDPPIFDFIRSTLEGKATIHFSHSGEKILGFLRKNQVDLVFVDLHLPTLSGHDIIKEIKKFDDSIQIIVVSSSDQIDDAIKAFRMGIADYLPKPLHEKDLEIVFQKCTAQNVTVKQSRMMQDHLESSQSTLLVGSSQPMTELVEQIQQLRNSPIDVLILGESGTGKELVAKMLNQQEGDKNRPYITLNCSAIPKELIESTLFGHEKGSFTGAIAKKLGKFELANGGDIFLDEIGTLPLDLQAKLLRVLQEREIEPVGLGYTKKLHFRVIAATNEPLSELVNEGRFRMDLFYRLNKAVLQIPPLKKRASDIKELIDHFLKKNGRAAANKKVTAAAIKNLQQHSWPGNVRELENIIENLIYTYRQDEIGPDAFSRFQFNINEGASSSSPQNENSEPGLNMHFSSELNLSQVVRNTEKAFIEYILGDSHSKQEAASRLNVDRKTLFRKIKLYQIP